MISFFQSHKIGGLKSAKQAEVVSGPSKIRDSNVRPSTLPLPFEIHKVR